MAVGGGAPPAEAMRGAKGVSVAIVAVVAIVLFVAGLGVGYLVFSPAPAKTRLVVGTNAPFFPFEVYNDTTGKFEGFDIDIAQLIADALGREMVVRNFNDFGFLLTTVGQGGVDIAVAAITSSGSAGQTRNNTMDFSNTYFLANQAVLIRSNYAFTCANNICTAANITDHTIGVQSQTTSEAWIDQYVTPNQTNPTQTIHRYPSVTTELEDLRLGVYDLMIIDEAPAKAYAATSGGVLKVAGAIITGELYGIAVANNDPKGLIPTINAVLTRIRADGTYDQLVVKWFSKFG